ncbi:MULTISPECIES: beta/alpha barrel domain-containing protein [Legionella]|uniref:4-hydroxy-2-oxovalerate aldolase n=1 Tax=Legionella TaxID=445 RepID=UPI000F8DBB03|nr:MULTISPECIES: 4-hydroxy-2-oxovalerate aldolase [Legionella]MCP0914605.1 4-hydroxy-2-oxovalerate aldolase [Legionella sp. 27cVA30]RUQ96170.1 4-hydroxy-2-oxovalerate aldolase [Legionella septentrionalis]RUR09352.1 4-hydroxy-2-oxovalerate aldolase [Legionella septentrionalis]RUR14302.1 4-hydroxy-2-oxovalerate aldolase [Legionella septentrionalis]
MNIQALDVTLRDGGNRTNFHFSDEDIQHILSGLDNSGIEYIEIGYRNGSIHPIPDLGRAGLCAKNYLAYCTSLIHHSRIAVMAHPQNLTQADLEELKSFGISMIRICIAKGGVQAAYSIMQDCRKLGFITSANFIHISQYHEPELDEAVEQISQISPDIVYFADSNGSLLPAKVKKMYEKYVNAYSMAFGFHAHDNLGLAQANAIAAAGAGVSYIDFSLAGMGKGIGNLRTEYFTAYLHALNIKKYRLESILPAANYVRKMFHTEQENIPMDEFERGILDLSTAEIKTKNSTNNKAS